jgi:hypothetical protein
MDGYCLGVKVEFPPVVDGVESRLTRTLVNLSFLGWGSGVAVAGGCVNSLITVSCAVSCCVWRIPQISHYVAGNHVH